MKTKPTSNPWLILMMGLSLVFSAQGQTITQTVPLNLGWNAIYLEVEPDDNAIELAFDGLPVEAVWSFIDKKTSVEFIQRPNELPWNNPSWRRYLPSNPNAFLQTLFTVNANTAYLVNMTNNATLVVTGRPRVRPFEWVPDSFNLRGFPVDPAIEPTFGSFFAPSRAHAGQPAYRLDPTGEWSPILSGDRIRSGEAYWVFSKGPSDFDALLELGLEAGDGLDYRKTLDEQRLRLFNRSLYHLGSTVVIENLGPGDPPLSYYDLFLAGSDQWVNLPSPHTVVVQPNQTWSRRIAVRRGSAEFATERYETVLQITDGQGSRYWLPVSAGKNLGGSGSGGGGTGGGFGGGIGPEHQGLWLGTATINGVSEVHVPASPATSTTNVAGQGSEFPLRLLLHVNTNGAVSLLKQVIQLWQDGSYILAPSINPSLPRPLIPDPDDPGRFVLLTDDTRIGEFKGASAIDGEAVGRRISCAAFDFEGTELPMNKFFGNLLQVSLRLRADAPTNPFLHREHPDHDNLDTDFETVADEVPEVTRDITLGFDGPDLSNPRSNYDQLTGTYAETLTGLHQHPIHVRGPFTLRRISHVGVLNPVVSTTP